MGTNEKGPVSIPLVGGTAAVFCIALLVYQHFSTLSLGSLCRTWLLLPLGLS